MLIVGILVGSTAATLASGVNPLSVTTGSAFEGLWAISIGSWSISSRDDVVGIDLADLLCNGGDDIVTELAFLTHIFALQTELVLLGHVVPSHGTNLAHDVEQDSFGGSVALKAVLGRIPHISASDVHGAICRKGNAIGKLLTPA